MPRAAPRHRARRLHDFPIQGHELRIEAFFPRDADGDIQRFDNDRVPEQVLHSRPDRFIKLDKGNGVADNARASFQRIGFAPKRPENIERQEGHASGLVALQIIDGSFGRARIFGHHVVDVAAQGRLDRALVLFFR